MTRFWDPGKQEAMELAVKVQVGAKLNSLGHEKFSVLTTSLSTVFCYTPASSALMKLLRINPSPVPCTRTWDNFLTCREVQGVVVWVDRGYRSEDEMWTEAWIQSLQGYVTLIVAQHHLAGGGTHTWTRCKTYRTYKNESFQALSWS